jgi:hypothetical protein
MGKNDSFRSLARFPVMEVDLVDVQKRHGSRNSMG